MGLPIAVQLAAAGYKALPTGAKAAIAGLTFPPLGIGAAAIAAATAITNKAQPGGKTMPGMNIIPGYDVNWANIIPGGAPFITPEGPQQAWNYAWTANGTNFYRSTNGWVGCYKKNGQWRQWRPYHPTVFGKKDDPRKLAKVIKRHHGSWKELNKVFGKRAAAPTKSRR